MTSATSRGPKECPPHRDREQGDRSDADRRHRRRAGEKPPPTPGDPADEPRHREEEHGSVDEESTARADEDAEKPLQEGPAPRRGHAVVHGVGAVQLRVPTPSRVPNVARLCPATAAPTTPSAATKASPRRPSWPTAKTARRAATIVADGRLASMTPAPSPAIVAPHGAVSARRRPPEGHREPELRRRVPPQPLARDRPGGSGDGIDESGRDRARLAGPELAREIAGHEIDERHGQGCHQGRRELGEGVRHDPAVPRPQQCWAHVDRERQDAGAMG